MAIVEFKTGALTVRKERPLKNCKECGKVMRPEEYGYISASAWETKEFCTRACANVRSARMGRNRPKRVDTIGPMDKRRVKGPASETTCNTPGCDWFLTQYDRDHGYFYCRKCRENLDRYLELKRRAEGYSVPREAWGRAEVGA